MGWGICLLAVVLVAFALRRRKPGILRSIVLMGLACLGPLTAPLAAAPMDRDIVTPGDVLARYGGVYDDPALNAMLADIAARLGAASGRTAFRPAVTVLDSPAVNAFVFRDGQYFVTRGLLALANDRAQAASAMAVVMARHAVTAGAEPQKADRANVAALVRPRIPLEIASSSQVMDADTVGIGIAARAGFDPYGAWRLFKSMKRSTELQQFIRYGSEWQASASSGSVTSDRVRNALAGAARNKVDGGAGNDGHDRGAYLHDIDGMTYGDKADEGYVRGTRFIHPGLGITFVAPEGFILDNTTEAVLGTSEGAGQSLRFDAVKLPTRASLVAYLRSGWIENIDDGSIEELTIDDIPAATAVTSPPVEAKHAEPLHFRIAVLQLGGEEYRFVFAARALTEDADRSFRQSIQSFRRLTEHEKTMQPWRLRVIAVESGDTVETLAARTVFADHQLERFRAVNGFEPGAELRPGDLVKIVVE